MSFLFTRKMTAAAKFKNQQQYALALVTYAEAFDIASTADAEKALSKIIHLFLEISNHDYNKLSIVLEILLEQQHKITQDQQSFDKEKMIKQQILQAQKLLTNSSQILHDLTNSSTISSSPENIDTVIEQFSKTYVLKPVKETIKQIETDRVAVTETIPTETISTETVKNNQLLEQLENQFSELNIKSNSQAEYLHKLREENSSLLEAIDSARQELASAQNSFKNKSSQNESRIKQLEIEITDLETLKAKAGEDLLRAEEKLLSDNVEVERDNNTLKNELSRSKENIKKYETELKKYKNTYNNLTNEKAQLNKSIKNLESESTLIKNLDKKIMQVDSELEQETLKHEARKNNHIIIKENFERKINELKLALEPAPTSLLSAITDSKPTSDPIIIENQLVPKQPKKSKKPKVKKSIEPMNAQESISTVEAEFNELNSAAKDYSEKLTMLDLKLQSILMDYDMQSDSSEFKNFVELNKKIDAAFSEAKRKEKLLNGGSTQVGTFFQKNVRLKPMNTPAINSNKNH